MRAVSIIAAVLVLCGGWFSGALAQDIRVGTLLSHTGPATS